MAERGTIISSCPSCARSPRKSSGANRRGRCRQCWQYPPPPIQRMRTLLLESSRHRRRLLWLPHPEGPYPSLPLPFGSVLPMRSWSLQTREFDANWPMRLVVSATSDSPLAIPLVITAADSSVARAAGCTASLAADSSVSGFSAATSAVASGTGAPLVLRAGLPACRV